jgi:acylphosphatase
VVALAINLTEPANMRNSSPERRTVYYSGRVQGVGFRFRVHQIAACFSVTGYVQNLSDGRVLLIAEGIPTELDSFLAQITETMADYIRRAETLVSSASGEFDHFHIQG